MPPPPLTVKVKKTGYFRPANLDNAALTDIGNQMVAAQKKRWASVTDADGNPAKPLSKKYFFIKKKITGQARPVRDMKLTGGLIKNFTLRKAIDNVIRAEPTARLERAKAVRCQLYGNMIGFAGSDQMTVFRAAEKQFGSALQKAFVPIVTP